MLQILSIALTGWMLFSCAGMWAQAVGEGKHFLSRFSLRHHEHKGMGYDQGYSTAALFVCPKIGILGLPFVDGRAHVFNNEDVAANLGVGARFADTKQTYLFGLNVYYDYRNMHWLVTHQLSSGLEILSEHIDFRINGYYPFSGKYQDDPIVFSRFRGNHLQVKHKVRYALPSADAELGWTLPDPFDQIGLYLGLGYYYLFKQQGFNQTVGNVPGVRARLTANPSPYISLGAEYTYDKLFQGRANGFIAFNIPLGANRSKMTAGDKGGKKPWIRMQTQDVMRNEIVPVLRKTHRFEHLRSDGQPMHFVFVNNQKLNNQGVGSGAGTFEEPYTTLALGQKELSEQDVLYVFAGEGSFKGYDQQIVLKSGQVLTSSGAAVTINGVEIPALTPGRFPVLTSTSESVIHVDVPGTTINGFKIKAQEGHGVYVEGVDVTLTNNEITAAQHFNAFKVVGTRQSVGKSVLQDNQFIGQGGAAHVVDMQETYGTYVLSGNTIYATEGQNGVQLSDPMNKTYMMHNTFISTDPSGIALEYHLSKEQMSQEHVCRYNSVEQGFYQALRINSEAATQTLFEIHDNTFTSETLGTAVSYTSASHHGSLSIMNNSISSSAEGICISDQKDAVHAIEMANNRLRCYSGTPTISAVFSGALDVTIEENKIEYVPNIKGKFPGVSFHIQENKEKGGRLVIRDNVLHMPEYAEGVQVVNDRLKGITPEIINNEIIH